MKTAFIVTSAVHTRFGIYSHQDRLKMTLETIQCLRDRIPDAKIILNEVSGGGVAPETEDALVNAVDVYLDFTTNPDVRGVYNAPNWYNNWDIVKNLTELSTFPMSLQTLWDSEELVGIDRVFKMSGRYLLNEKFNLDFYDTPEVQDKIVIGKSVPSQFPFQVTGLTMQYMCRLLSWPIKEHLNMVKHYIKGRDYMIQRMGVGGYSDIEHCLYYSIPKESVYEVDEVGVYGNIAPNGHPIRN